MQHHTRCSGGVGGLRTERAYLGKEFQKDDSWGVDCEKQYSSCLFLHEWRWPIFSLLDGPELFDLSEPVVPGYYHVVDFACPGDPSWEGPGAYPHSWVAHHKERLRPSDVTEVVRASYSLDCDLFKAVIREICSHGLKIGKCVANLTVGLMDIEESRVVRDHVLTPDLEEMQHYVLSHVGGVIWSGLGRV